MKICVTIATIVLAITQAQICLCDSTYFTEEALGAARKVLKTVLNKLATGQTRDFDRTRDVGQCAECILSSPQVYTEVCPQACTDAARRTVTTELNRHKDKPYEDQKLEQCLSCLRKDAYSCNRKCRNFDLDKILTLIVTGKGLNTDDS